MKHNNIIFRGIVLLQVTLVLVGCAAPKPEPCPTTAPQSCPSVVPLSCPTTVPQSCPTTAEKAMPEMDAYRTNTIDPQANVIFTFDPGDKCSMQIRSRPTTSDFVYQIIVNDQAHLNYMLSGTTLNPGHTDAELKDFIQKNPNPPAPPSFMSIKIYEAVNPMSNTIQLVQYSGDPIYFTCLTEGPDAHQVIANFDPLVMPTK